MLTLTSVSTNRVGWTGEPVNRWTKYVFWRKLYKYMIYNILLIITYFYFVWKKWKFTSSPVHLFTFFARVFKTVKTAKGPVKSGFMRQMTGLFSDAKINYSVLKKGPKNFGRYFGFCSPFRILYKIELTPYADSSHCNVTDGRIVAASALYFAAKDCPCFDATKEYANLWTGELVNFAFTRSRRSPSVSQPAGDCFFSSPFFWSFRALALTSP